MCCSLLVNGSFVVSGCKCARLSDLLVFEWFGLVTLCFVGDFGLVGVCGRLVGFLNF